MLNQVTAVFLLIAVAFVADNAAKRLVNVNVKVNAGKSEGLGLGRDVVLAARARGGKFEVSITMIGYILQINCLHRTSIKMFVCQTEQCG